MVGLVPPERNDSFTNLASSILMWLDFAPLPRLPRRGEDHVVLHDGVLGGLVHVEGGELVAQLLQLGELSRGVAPEKGQRQY